MKTKASVINKTNYSVTFTAKEVIAMLQEIIKEKHPNLPDKCSVYGFDRGWLCSDDKEFRDIEVSWVVKHE